MSAKEIAQMAKDECFNMTTVSRAKPDVAESILRYRDETKRLYWRLRGDTTETKGVTTHPEQDTGKAESESYLRGRKLWE